MLFVGLSGLAGSGKDTVADILEAKYGFVKISFADPLKRICKDVFKFSDEQLWGPSEMRNALDKRYPREHVYPDQITSLITGSRSCACCGYKYDNHTTPYVGEPQCYLTPRYALQLIGTDWGRNCYKPIWIEYAMRVVENLKTGKYHYTQKNGEILKTTAHTEIKGVVISDCRFLNEIMALRAADGKLIRVKRDTAGLAGEAGRHASEQEQMSIQDDVFDLVINNSGTLAQLNDTIDNFVVGMK